MLESLKNLDQKEVQRVLSAIITSLLPTPDWNREEPESHIDPSLHEKVLREIHKRTKVDPSDTSLSSKAKIYDLLFQEMSEAALHGVNIESLKMRIGQRGDLRSD